MQRKLAYINVGAFDISVSDIDGDGILGITDVTTLQRWLAGFPDLRKVGKPVPGYEVELE